METNISVAPPSRRSMRLQPEPPVATESRPCRLSLPSQSPERESRPRRSPEDENIGEYFIICSSLYLILYAFLSKINTLFLFLLINYVSNYIYK